MTYLFLSPRHGHGALVGRIAATLRPRERQRATTQSVEIARLGAALAAAEGQLVRRESFMAAVLERIDIGIVFCGPDGNDWTRNRAGRSLLGLDAGDASTRTPEDAAPLMDVLDAAGVPVPVTDYPVLRALRGEDVGSVELRVGPAGGPHREVVSLNSQILDAQGEVLGAVCALTDVTAERVSSRATAEQHRQLNEAQRIGRLGSFERDLRTGRATFSEQLCALWGVPADSTSPISEALIHPEDRTATVAGWTTALTAGGTHTFEFRILRADDGTERRIRSNVEVELGADGRAEHMRGTHLDITELAAAELAAERASAFMAAVLTASPDYTFVTDLSSGAVVYGSRNKVVLGLTTDELEAMGPQAVSTLVHPDDIAKIRDVNVAAADMADGTVLQVRYRGRHTDGQWHWISRRVTPFKRVESGAVVEVLGVMRDITDAVAAEERLTHASLHDSLTGLPNRNLLMDRLQTALDRSARDGREVAVLFCDLDGFKLVNDTAGHAAGDAVLQETSQRIASALREGDTVARVGGDEFVIVVEPRESLPDHLADEPDAVRSTDRATGARIAARIAAAVRRPISYDGEEHAVTASIGMTFARHSRNDDAGPVDPETVLKNADDLMYQAKSRGKDRVEMWAGS